MTGWYAFVAHGVTLSLAWFTAVNVVVSTIVALAAWQLVRASTVGSPALWLVLRLLPAAASIAFVGIVFVPSYWRYEPRELVEPFDVTLTLVAAAGLALVAAAIVRGTLAARRANRRVRRWMRGARPMEISERSLQAFEIDADQPVIALSGVFRHRLLVTRGLLRTLSAPELAASVAHEIGHRRALDNLKRLAMRAAPDVLGMLPAARALEQRWALAAEHAADRAAATGAAARCALASALLKVARLTPPAARVAEPISTLIAGGDIASRVRHLLDDAEPRHRRTPVVVLWTGALAAAALATSAYTPLLRAVHEATELIVRSLS